MVEEYVEKRVLLTVKNILIANFKLLMGHAIYADVMGKADASNSELVEGTVTRSAVSKAATRLRRGVGLTPRCPNHARAGAKAKQADGTTVGALEKSIPWKFESRAPGTERAAVTAHKTDLAKSSEP